MPMLPLVLRSDFDVFEPPDLWQTRIDAAFRDRAPRIVSRDGLPPEAQCAGWKDVAPISAGGVTEILVRFPFSAARDDRYTAHCHILEHVASGMMTQFTVS